ncbi:hypothetical protein [Puerhibacterium puerhi]|uniref:hypothetical protein n=1 Tax=Puerhibacterium puerhi TaxID=2692623 RepID=UPI00135C3C6B|nr:hypothetical protein [Puerhibacterium puerhi]
MITTTYTARGTGAGPTLAEVKRLVAELERAKLPEATVIAVHHESGDRPGELSAWSLTVTGAGRA